MKRQLSAQEIINYYIEIGPILEDSVLSGNYKKGNQFTKKSIDIFKLMEQDLDLAKVVLIELLNENNIETKITAAAYCLSLKIYVDKAVEILKTIKKDKGTMIFGFEAEMILKEWKRGDLKIY